MATFNVEIINPRAKRILQELADLKLIVISENAPDPFFEVVKRIRSKKAGLTEKDISKEVAAVRTKRYGKKA
jgi:hypothetical protein